MVARTLGSRLARGRVLRTLEDARLEAELEDAASAARGEREREGGLGGVP